MATQQTPGAADAGASSGVLQTAKQDWEAYWLKMVILELLFSYVFLVISASTVVSFFVVLIATRSLRGDQLGGRHRASPRT